MKSPASLAGKQICRYVRVSKDIQEGERQVFSTDQWAKFNGLYIDDSFEDTEGANSRDMSSKRVQFQKMMKLCESGDYDAIVVDSLDRFGFKNNKELQYYLYLLDQWGVELWSVSQGCISDDDVATVFNTTAAAITSEKEQKEKALRNLEGRMANSKKGNYCGGPPPYGFDVACYGEDGKEKWRVVWIGTRQREKHNSDGSVEQYNGKNNFPSRDATDTLKLAPSIREERLEAIRKIFEWYSEELISFYQIAVRLNKEGIDKEKNWNKGQVQKVLNNPIVTGYPTDNKKGQGRFYEYVDGKVRLVNPEDSNRVRDEEDYWRPENQIFDSVIPMDLWNDVQKKLKERAGKRHGPNPQRRAEFWLQPFMYCAGCGKRMRSVKVRNGKQDKFCKYYSCSTYSVYGPSNEQGCQSNTITKNVMEEIVEAYLMDAGKKLDFDSRLCNLHKDYEPEALQKMQEKHKVKITIRDNFKDMLKDQLVDVDDREDVSISKAYKLVDQKREVEEDLVGRIKKLQKEFEDVYQHAKILTDEAKERANEEMNTVAKEIKRLRGMMAPQDRAEKIDKELDKWMQKIDQAMWSLKANNPRQKAQTVGKVIEKIICKFEKFDKNKEAHLALGTFGARKRKTILTEIEIVPVVIEKGLLQIVDLATICEKEAA